MSDTALTFNFSHGYWNHGKLAELTAAYHNKNKTTTQSKTTSIPGSISQTTNDQYTNLVIHASQIPKETFLSNNCTRVYTALGRLHKQQDPQCKVQYCLSWTCPQGQIQRSLYEQAEPVHRAGGEFGTLQATFSDMNQVMCNLWVRPDQCHELVQRSDFGYTRPSMTATL